MWNSQYSKILFVVILFAISLMIVGCSSPSSENDQQADHDAEPTASDTESDQDTESNTDFPNRPIEVIVGFGTGGGADQMAREWVRAVNEIHPDIEFIVTNMSGANGMTALSHVMSQPADGYTMYQVIPDGFISEYLNDNIEYTKDDLSYISALSGSFDMILISGDEDRFSTWDEIVEYGNESSEDLELAISALTGFTDLSGGQFIRNLDLPIERVPYPEPNERFAALMGGHVDLLFGRYADIRDLIESGEMEPVLTFTEERVFEDVPTTVEKGSDSTMVITRGFGVHADTPEENVEFLRDIFMEATDTDVFQEYAEQQESEEVYSGEELKDLMETTETGLEEVLNE